MASSKTKLKFGIVSKRARCINSESKYKVQNVEKRYDILSAQLENYDSKKENVTLRTNINSNLKKFLESLNDSVCANEFKEYPLHLMEVFSKIDITTTEYICSEYTKCILPYIKDLGVLYETVDRYNLIYKDQIIESLKQYIAADRVLENHKTISKRFNIEKSVLNTNNIGLKAVTENCCSMIDTYNIASYQKLNLCIEEMSYLFERNNIEYNRNDFINYVLEYFLLSNNKLTSNELKGFRKALSEGCYLSDEDLKSVHYIFENDIIANNISEYIQQFSISQEKNISLFEETLNKCIRSDATDIKYNFIKIIYFINDIYKLDLFDPDQIKDVLNKWLSELDLIFTEFSESKQLSREAFIELKTAILSTAQNDSYDFVMFIMQLSQKIDYYIDLVYTESNLSNITFVNNNTCEAVALCENKLFKHKNILRAIHNLDKYLVDKCAEEANKIKNKVAKVKNKVDSVLFPEEEKSHKKSELLSKLKNAGTNIISNIKGLIATKESFNYYEFIGEDNKFDITLYRMPIEDEIDYTIHDELSDICEAFNNQLLLQGIDTAKCYYLINPGVVEIHLKESTPIALSEVELEAVHNHTYEELEYYLEQLALADTCCDYLSECNSIDITSILCNYFANENCDMTDEKFEVALEALSLLEVDKSTVSLFAEKYRNHKYYMSESSLDESALFESINTLEDNYYPEYNVPIDIQTEAYLILDTLLEVSDDKKDLVYGTTKSYMQKQQEKDKMKSVRDAKKNKDIAYDDDKEEIKKNPFKGINLNTMKLYLQGLKANFKKMSQKEKEVSRNIDATCRRLVKSMKDALISDRREAIIKGSVIPSFSKCLKIGLALAGMAKFINPTAAVITAIGGFAMSKHLTKQERLLLLDEIETELNVVEKEIQMAESDNNMKKYRALLKYQKDLQRQYQRIRYNVRVGKDILPNSTIGLKNTDY